MNPELIYKYLENTATDAETEQVLDWLDADPAHMRELDELDKVMAASVIYGPDVLSPALARKAARRISLGRIPLRRIVRYAAELAAKPSRRPPTHGARERSPSGSATPCSRA